MKILKLLNDILLLILLILISNKSVYSEEAVDIWNIKANTNNNNQISDENEISNTKNSIIISGEEILDKTVITVNEDSNSFTNKNEIVGIYDPEINDLSIDMWKKTDGVRLSETLNKIFELNLSEDSSKILNISLLTNSYSPTNNISFEEVTHKSVRQGAFEANVPTIIGPVSSKEIRMPFDWKSAQQFTKNPVKITLPGPMTITDSIANNYYDDLKKLGFDLALALNKEIKALVDAGCKYIQIDEPVFARKPEEANIYGMENLERMMHGIPKDVQRECHICCGYPNSLDSTGYKKADLDAYDRIATLVDDSTIDAVSLEDSHRHNDLNLLEKFKKTKVIFGFIDIAKSRMESVEEVRTRMKDSLEHIDEHRLIAAPDCGLGFFTREQAIEKMSILSKAAKSI